MARDEGDKRLAPRASVPNTGLEPATTDRGLPGVLLVALLLLLPSAPVIVRFLGPGWVPAYLAFGLAGVAGLRRWGRPWLARRDERQLIALSVALLAALAVLLALVYPAANRGLLGGGSDRDDALLLAGQALLEGRYPYDARTYLGNPITPLPGAILLALPFAALGSVALQNLVWPAIWLWTSGAERRRALLALVLLLGFCPLALNELLTGGDLLVNGLYVWVFGYWGLRRAGEGRRWPAALLVGVGLASRLTVLPLLPLWLAVASRRAGRRHALGLAALVGAAWVALVAPFYFWAPERFTPWHTLQELAALDAAWPMATWMIGALTLAATGGLALWVQRGRISFTAAGALALAAPVLAAAALGLALEVGGWPSFLRFGLVYLPWAALWLTGPDLALNRPVPVAPAG